MRLFVFGMMIVLVGLVELLIISGFDELKMILVVFYGALGSAVLFMNSVMDCDEME